jgi:MFS transporter, ACDE family, multidrug resistance protein
VIGFFTIGSSPLLVLVLVGAVLYGLGEGVSIPTIQDIVAGSAPEASRGAIVAAWVGAARAGQTVGPLLAGLSLVLAGARWTFLIGGFVAVALLLAQLLVRVDRMEDRRAAAPR